MDSLSPEDSNSAIRIVADASDPTQSVHLAERKRILLAGLARLVKADVWIWTLGSVNPHVRGDAAATNIIDGGWQSDEQRALVISRILDPPDSTLLTPLFDAVQARRAAVFTRQDLTPDGYWDERGNDWRATGLNEFIVALRPLEEGAFSSIMFCRRDGGAKFDERDHRLVGAVSEHVDWLHKHGMKSPARHHAVGLSPRTRLALVYLLAGESKKGVAAKMGISEHTAGDYLKQIYRHFNVRGRNELFALLASGNDMQT